MCMMKQASYESPRCWVYTLDAAAPLLTQSQFDFVDGNGFIQVVTGEGVKPEDGI